MTTNPPPADTDLMGLADELEQVLAQASCHGDYRVAETKLLRRILAALRTPSPVADEALVELVAREMLKACRTYESEFRVHMGYGQAEHLARAALQQVQPLIGGGGQ